MQLEFFDVPSPCVGVCQTNEKGHCLGCMRSRIERQEWQDYDSDKKQKVIKLCIQRKKRKEAKVNIVKADTAEEQTEKLTTASPQPSLLDPPVKTVVKHDLDFGDFEL
jgi:predicted Fe-S protein YdhL (DUF1289 family)